MTKPSWELIAAFAAVMRAGSLSAAARELRLAQPTVRRQIAELEAVLGCTLFTRSTAGLLATQAARDAQPLAETMATTAEALARAASGERHQAEGVVRITCSEVIGVEVLPRLLAPIARDYPAIQLEVSLTDRIEDVVRGDADLAIRMLRPRRESLVTRRAARIEIGLFASEGYLAQHGSPRALDELAQHWLIGDDRARLLLPVLQAHGLRLTRRDFRYRTDSGVAQLAAIRAGLGIGACQAPLAGVSTPPLRRVLPAMRAELEAWITMHEDLKTVRRTRLIFDALVDGFARYAGP